MPILSCWPNGAGLPPDAQVEFLEIRGQVANEAGRLMGRAASSVRPPSRRRMPPRPGPFGRCAILTKCARDKPQSLCIIKSTNEFWWQFSWGAPTGSAAIFCQNQLLLALWVAAPIKTHRSRAGHPKSALPIAAPRPAVLAAAKNFMKVNQPWTTTINQYAIIPKQNSCQYTADTPAYRKAIGSELSRAIQYLGGRSHG